VSNDIWDKFLDACGRVAYPDVDPSLITEDQKKTAADMLLRIFMVRFVTGDRKSPSATEFIQYASRSIIILGIQGDDLKALSDITQGFSGITPSEFFIDILKSSKNKALSNYLRLVADYMDEK